MALLNIGASNRDDAFYRYKMPRLVTKIEGRGNGIKTNLVNMVDVAKALARPPAYTTKFFGCELGAQSKFDEKTATAIVNGAHETAKLAALLEIFIKKYVQCYGCKNPETEVLVTKTQTIILKCAACGYISDVDMRDKLTTFILKNPPEQKKSGKEKKALRRAEKERMKEGELADEENKKAKKEAIKKKKGHEDEKKPSKKKLSGSEEDEETSPLGSQADEEEDESDDVEWQTDTSVAAAQQRIKEQLTTATTEMVMLSVDDDDVVDSPRSASFKEKTGKTKLKKSGSGKKHEANGHAKDDDGTEQELSMHESLLKEFKDEILKGSTPSQMASIIESKKCDQQDVLVLYVQALFGGISKGLSKEVLKRKAYLAAVVNDASAQDRLLVAFETYFASCPDIGKEVAIVLKVLYDEDIIEEESILEWFGRQPSLDLKAGFVRKEARPFIDWLQNAEAESEEDE